MVKLKFELWYNWNLNYGITEICCIFRHTNSNFSLLKYASNVPCFMQVCAALYRRQAPYTSPKTLFWLSKLCINQYFLQWLKQISCIDSIMELQITIWACLAGESNIFLRRQKVRQLTVIAFRKALEHDFLQFLKFLFDKTFVYLNVYRYFSSTLILRIACNLKCLLSTWKRN